MLITILACMFAFAAAAGEANFGVVEAGKSAVSPMVCGLSGYAATNVTATLAPPAHPFFDVRLDGRTVTAAFREPPSAPGFYTEIWKLKTTDAEIPEIALPVSARVTGGLSVAAKGTIVFDANAQIDTDPWWANTVFFTVEKAGYVPYGGAVRRSEHYSIKRPVLI